MSGLVQGDRRSLFPVAPARLARNALCLFAFVAVFGLVGPVVGGLVAWIMMADGSGSPLPFVTGAYPEGILLALAAGVLCGLTVLLSGSASWVIPVAAVIVVIATFVMASVIGDLSRPDLLEVCVRLTWVFFPPSLVATVICWAVARRLLVSR